jgi:hypothetical protein
MGWEDDVEEWRAKGRADSAARRRGQVRDASTRYADRQLDLGMIRVALWVPREHADALRAHARLLTERRPAGITLDPGDLDLLKSATVKHILP